MQLPSFFVLAGGFALSSCASSRQLAIGNYQETRGPGVMMWTSQHLRILPGQAFQYYISTDDESGRYGAGSYTLQGNQVQLLFDGKALVPASYAEHRPLPTLPDSLLLNFEVYDTADGNSPWAWATIIMRDAAGHIEKLIPTDTHGRVAVRLAHSQRPYSISVRNLGSQTIELPRPDSSTAYKVFLQPSAGTLYPAGSALRFQVLKQTSTQLVVRQGKHKTTFLATP